MKGRYFKTPLALAAWSGPLVLRKNRRENQKIHKIQPLLQKSNYQIKEAI